MRLFEESRGASLKDVSWLRKAMSRRLSDLRLRPSLIYDLALAGAEIMSNVARHGAPAPQQLSLAVDLIGSRVKISVGDDGGPFKDFFMRWPEAALNAAFLEGGGGRGLSLIREVLQDVTYESDSSGNMLCGMVDLVAKQPVVLIFGSYT